MYTYRQQRDVTVEMELDCTANGPFSFVVVPSTYADEVSSEFIVSALFVEENGRRREVTIEPLEGKSKSKIKLSIDLYCWCLVSCGVVH